MTEIGLGHYLTLGAVIFSIGIIGIFFSINQTTAKAIIVAIMKGGIAVFRSFSLLKYITKKIRSGPKSANNLIRGLFIAKC